MSLRNTVLYVIVGMAYLFLVRLIATIVPEINSSPAFFRANSLLTLLAALAPAAFFAVFQRDFVRKEQATLRRATLWALIGSAAVAFLLLKGPVIAFRLRVFPGLFQFPLFETVGPGVALVSSLLILVFFIFLYRELRATGHPQLARAALVAVAGSAASVLIRTALFLSYLVTGDLRWISDLPTSLQWGLLPAETLAFLAMFYFFFTLHRLQRIQQILDVA